MSSDAGSHSPACNGESSSSSLSSLTRALETPYNSNDEVPTFCGLLFRLDAYSNITITSLDLDVRFPTSTTTINTDEASSVSSPVNVNRPRVDVYYRRGPYMAAESGALWLSASSDWIQVYRGKADRDGDREEGVKLAPANFTSIAAQSGDVISFYVTMKGPFLDSTAHALMKTGEALVVGSDMRINVGSGLTDVSFPQLINTTIDPGFAGVIHYELQSDTEQEPAATSAPCSPSSPNMTVTELVFPMLWSSNETNVTISRINFIVERAMQQYLERQHRNAPGRRLQNTDNSNGFSAPPPPGQLVQVGNATTDKESGWLYTGMCPEILDSCPPPAAYKTTFRFEHDANAYPPSILLNDLYHASLDMVVALNNALDNRTTAGYDENDGKDVGLNDDGASPTDPQVAYVGPVPTRLLFDMTLTLRSNSVNDGHSTGYDVPRLDESQLDLLGVWIEQFLDVSIKSLTANHFVVRNLTNGNPSRKMLRRHVRRLKDNNERQQLLVSGTLLGLYESDRVRSGQQYVSVVSDAFENTGEAEFLAFLDAEVAHDSNGSSSTSIFPSVKSVFFAPTLVLEDNSTSAASGGSTDPSPAEATVASNTTLLNICGVAAGCLAVAAAVLFFYCCFCKRSTKKTQRLKATSEERAPDRPTTSERPNPLERSGSRMSESARRIEKGASRGSSNRWSAGTNPVGSPRRAPQRSQSGPVGAASSMGESNDRGGIRSGASSSSPTSESRGFRRSTSSPIAASPAKTSRPTLVSPIPGEDRRLRARSQSFDGSPSAAHSGEGQNGAGRSGREIRRSRSCDDMPAIREGVSSPPRRKTRPPQAQFSSGVVPGVPTQPPRHPIKKSQSLDSA